MAERTKEKKGGSSVLEKIKSREYRKTERRRRKKKNKKGCKFCIRENKKKQR